MPEAGDLTLISGHKRDCCEQSEQQYCKKYAAEADVGSAEADVGSAEADVGSAEADVGSAEADVRSAEAELVASDEGGSRRRWSQ